MVGFLKLNNGTVMPSIALGVGTRDNRTEGAIMAAIEIGYRCFDTARQYGTESLLGATLAKAFKAGLVRREDIFVTTKLSPFDTHPADVVAALRSSLSDLQLEYVDLFLVHWPLWGNRSADFRNVQPGDIMVVDQRELWPAMESCVDAGLARAIGVSNWSVKKLEELLSLARIPPAVNQVEMHPLWRQEKLRAFCEQKGIAVTAYSPLGAPNSTYGNNDVITNATINDIARRVKKTPAQVVLHWFASTEVAVVVRSYDRSRLEENFHALGCSLAESDLHALDTIVEQSKAVTGQMFVQPEHGPFKSLKDLWDED